MGNFYANINSNSGVTKIRPAKVVIWMGQSNSQGAMAMASLQAQYKNTFNRIKVWNITNSTFDPLNYLVNNNQWPVGSQINCFGSEFSTLYLLQQYWNQTVYGITYAIGGTELGTAIDPVNNWNAATSSSYYSILNTTINNAITALAAIGVVNIDFYFIFDQGEQDCKNLTDTNNRQANMTAFINGVRANLTSQGFASANKRFIIPLTNANIVSTQNSVTTITDATNANPIVITTSGSHGLNTGDQCKIYGVVGNTAANVSAPTTITRLSNTTFSIPIAGNGAYISGGWINQFCYPVQIATADVAAANSLLDVWTYSTNNYPLQVDVTHFDAQGYESKGCYAAYNIIIANGL